MILDVPDDRAIELYLEIKDMTFEEALDYISKSECWTVNEKIVVAMCLIGMLI